MRYDFDVIIAGGGPAGSSTANYLRQRGRSVLVLEREKFPRFHIGESLLPFGNDIWKELGVFEAMMDDPREWRGKAASRRATPVRATGLPAAELGVA